MIAAASDRVRGATIPTTTSRCEAIVKSIDADPDNGAENVGGMDEEGYKVKRECEIAAPSMIGAPDSRGARGNDGLVCWHDLVERGKLFSSGE